MEWSVYIIQASDDSLYTGITTDIVRRWKQHESGKTGARFFRGRKPAALAYLEHGHDRSSASSREYAIKQLDRKTKLKLIADTENKARTLENELPIVSLTMHD